MSCLCQLIACIFLQYLCEKKFGKAKNIAFWLTLRADLIYVMDLLSDEYCFSKCFVFNYSRLTYRKIFHWHFYKRIYFSTYLVLFSQGLFSWFSRFFYFLVLYAAFLLACRIKPTSILKGSHRKRVLLSPLGKVTGGEDQPQAHPKWKGGDPALG